MGDDLLCTNPVRVQKAIDTKACNALLLKVGGCWALTWVLAAKPRSRCPSVACQLGAGSSRCCRAPAPPPTTHARSPRPPLLIPHCLPIDRPQVNQIGSLTESIQAVKMSKDAGWGVMTSHR